MTKQPRLTDLDLWARHESRALALLRSALGQLAATGQRGLANANEDGFTRQLHRLIQKEVHEKLKAGEDTLIGPPAFEPRPAPRSDGDEPEPFERKRPDLIWSYTDETIDDAGESCREFAIECKRLGGTNTSQHNTLVNKYVDKGIQRFVSENHRYGQYGAGGAMIGYVVASTHTVLIQDVNARARQCSLPELVGDPGSLQQPVAELEQALSRTFPERQYKLRHLWADVSGRSP